MAVKVGELFAFLKLNSKDYTEGLQEAEKQAEKSTKSMTKSLDKFSKSALRIGKAMSAAITLPIIGVGAAFLKAASDAEETNGKFNVVFRDQAESVREWAQVFARSVNRGTTETIGFLASIQDTLVPMGLARDRAAELSKDIVTLATDLSSMNNLPTADVMRDFQSALVGNSETVRKYGVIINEAKVEQELLNLGVEGGKKAASDAEIVQARYNLILQSTIDAQGDAIRTADSFANQMQGLKGDVRDLAEAFGSQLLPMAKEVVEVVRELIQQFTDLSGAKKNTIIRILAITAALGPLAFGIGFVTKAVRLLKIAFTTLAAHPVIAGLALLGAAIAAVTTKFRLMIAEVRDVNKELREQKELQEDLANTTVFGVNAVINQLKFLLPVLEQEKEKLKIILANTEEHEKVWVESKIALKQAEIAEATQKLAALTGELTKEIIQTTISHKEFARDALKALPVVDQETQKLIDTLDAEIIALGKIKKEHKDAAEVGKDAAADLRKSWQEYRKEVLALVAAENLLIDKKDAVAAALGEPFDAIAAKKDVLRNAIDMLLELTEADLEDPFKATDNTIGGLIEQLKALGLTEEELDTKRKERSEANKQRIGEEVQAEREASWEKIREALKAHLEKKRILKETEEAHKETTAAIVDDWVTSINALSGMLSEVFTGSTRDVLDAWLDMSANMAASMETMEGDVTASTLRALAEIKNASTDLADYIENRENVLLAITRSINKQRLDNELELNKRRLDSTNETIAAKERAAADAFDREHQAELAALDAELETRLIHEGLIEDLSQSGFDKRIALLEAELAATEDEEEQKTLLAKIAEEEREKLRLGIIQNFETERKALEDARDDERLSAIEDAATEEKSIRAELEKDRRQLLHDRAVIERDIAVAQAEIGKLAAEADVPWWDENQKEAVSTLYDQLIAQIGSIPLPALRGGGIVPGIGNQDSQMIRATPGEMVVNKQATAQNRALLEAINSGQGMSITPGTVNLMMDSRKVGEAIIPFLMDAARRGQLRFDPRAIRADV